MALQPAGGGTAYVPSGLPPGVDPESGEYLNQPLQNDGSATNWFTTVPGGECWLVHAVWFTIFTDATAVIRVPVIQFENGDGVIVSRTFASPSIPASSSADASFMIGQAAAGTVAQAPRILCQGPLPVLYLYGGFRMRLGLVGVAGADTIPNPGLPTDKSMSCFVTKWDVGSSSQPPDQQLGPFMYVPGPQPTAA